MQYARLIFGCVVFEVGFSILVCCAFIVAWFGILPGASLIVIITIIQMIRHNCWKGIRESWVIIGMTCRLGIFCYCFGGRTFTVDSLLVCVQFGKCLPSLGKLLHARFVIFSVRHCEKHFFAHSFSPPSHPTTVWSWSAAHYPSSYTTQLPQTLAHPPPQSRTCSIFKTAQPALL